MPDNVPETPRISHKWEPIEDLPENGRDLCRPDLHAVHRQWVADRKPHQGSRRNLPKRFRIELALHSGPLKRAVIERLYKVDRGVTVQILEAGMEALGQFHAEGPYLR